MPTRSTIAVEHEDGTVSYVYCHYDGFLKGNGATLLKCYNTRELAEELVFLGDINVLGEYINPPKKANSDNELEDGGTGAPPVNESYQWTEYWGRDHGWKDRIGATKFANMDAYLDGVQRQEFDYLFCNGVWYVTKCGDDLGTLEEALAHEESSAEESSDEETFSMIKSAAKR